MLNVPPTARKLRREFFVSAPPGVVCSGCAGLGDELSGLESVFGLLFEVKIVLQNIDAHGRRQGKNRFDMDHDVASGAAHHLLSIAA